MSSGPPSWLVSHSHFVCVRAKFTMSHRMQPLDNASLVALNCVASVCACIAEWMYLRSASSKKCDPINPNVNNIKTNENSRGRCYDVTLSPRAVSDQRTRCHQTSDGPASNQAIYHCSMCHGDEKHVRLTTANGIWQNTHTFRYRHTSNCILDTFDTINLPSKTHQTPLNLIIFVFLLLQKLQCGGVREMPARAVMYRHEPSCTGTKTRWKMLQCSSQLSAANVPIRRFGTSKQQSCPEFLISCSIIIACKRTFRECAHHNADGDGTHNKITRTIEWRPQRRRRRKKTTANIISTKIISLFSTGNCLMGLCGTQRALRTRLHF